MNFSATIGIIGINPNVVVPENILKQLYKASGKTTGPIPVKGLINGKPFIQTVVKYQKEYRLYINGIMIKTTKVKVGDKINVEIEYDPRSRAEKVPAELKKAFAMNPEAKKTFDSYPPYRQKEILRYLNNIKSKEILQKNIEKTTQHLLGQKVDGLIVLTYKKS